MGTSTRAFHIFDIPSSLAEANADIAVDIRKELQQHADETLVTFVGSFAVYQGVDLMFSAIPHVLEQTAAVRFVVIGGSEQEIEQRKKLLAEQGVAAHVTFLGKVPPDSLVNYLAASDILLSPRVSGVNTPLKILDYMKVGRAILATDVESNRLLVDETTAVLAPPEPKPFAAAVSSLATDPEKRNILGKAGRKLYETRYNFQQFRQRLNDCYAYVEGR